MKKSLAFISSALAVAGVYYGTKKWLSKPTFKKTLALGMAGVVASAPAHAMSERAIQQFAHSMKVSANAQNIGQLSALIGDDAIISITRKGKTTVLDKNAYLQLLQKSWAGAKDYHYDITMSDVVITGNQARAQVKTVESWIKDGKKTTLTTISRTTLQENGQHIVLLRSVSQITLE